MHGGRGPMKAATLNLIPVPGLPAGALGTGPCSMYMEWYLQHVSTSSMMGRGPLRMKRHPPDHQSSSSSGSAPVAPPARRAPCRALYCSYRSTSLACTLGRWLLAAT